MPRRAALLAMVSATTALEFATNAALSRRHTMRGLATAAAGTLATTVAPRVAAAESVPTPDELRKLTLGYNRMQTLLKDWKTITAGSCKDATLSKEKSQVVATNGGSLCDASPLVIQDYIGYKSINDPLYRAEKLMVRAAPLVQDSSKLDEYLEAVNLWGQKAQMSSLNAYTSAWGEANPNGSKAQSAAYLQEARYDVEESADLLKRIILMLGLPLTA
mmetsp:Transcript_12427/g.38310  ORF Transcript_12427/g.38310 Transcript_12427/m.38310 type:complete len:218 (-) Transcript_12427:127-780(-)